MPSYILTQVFIQICSISYKTWRPPPPKKKSNFGGLVKKNFRANAPIYPPNRHTKSPPLLINIGEQTIAGNTAKTSCVKHTTLIQWPLYQDSNNEMKHKETNTGFDNDIKYNNSLQIS